MPVQKQSKAIEAASNRRHFLRGAGAAAAGLVGAVAMKPALAQSATPIEGFTREELRRDMLAGVEDDIRKDLEMRAAASEELPRPANLKAPGMLDARFTVSYKSAVPDAMRLLTDY